MECYNTQRAKHHLLEGKIRIKKQTRDMPEDDATIRQRNIGSMCGELRYRR